MVSANWCYLLSFLNLHSLRRFAIAWRGIGYHMRFGKVPVLNREARMNHLRGEWSNSEKWLDYWQYIQLTIVDRKSVFHNCSKSYFYLCFQIICLDSNTTPSLNLSIMQSSLAANKAAFGWKSMNQRSLSCSFFSPDS